jgi:peptidoglycan/xylan/chitin deacetylase (PgdA/CDA1 family)
METKVIVTIDTEVRGHDRPDVFDHDVLGRTKSNSKGSFWIADELKRHGLQAVFFLDVYGVGRYPNAPYRELCDYLMEAGHDIQLHTHPDQMYDPERFNMHDYSLDEQTRIIEDGMKLIKDWTGKLPNVHRAGRYGANEDTLKAIAANGIYFDSSFYFGRANCKLDFPKSNHPSQKHGVWEFPVTVADEPVVKKGFRFPFWSRRFLSRPQKLDVNTMADWQLCHSIDELYGQVPYLITFLHSFSFTKLEGAKWVPDEMAIRSFMSMLKHLSQKGHNVTTFEPAVAELRGRALETVKS